MRKILTVLLFITMSLISFSQTPDWKRIDLLLGTQQAQAAKQLILKYHDQALENNNCQDIIRSYLYLTKTYRQYREDPLKDIIKYIENDLPHLRQPCLSIAQALLAHYYYAYYDDNSYEILDRTYIPGKQLPLEQWAIENFAIKCAGLFAQALENKDQLLKIDVTAYPEMFTQGNLPTELRPTMYDFIAYWALDFYQDKIFDLTHPKDRFTIDNPEFFAPAEDFANLKISTTDTLSNLYQSLKLYQSLIRAHLNNQSPALTDADIKRINYVYKLYTGPDKDSLYLNALENIVKSYDNWRTALAKYYLAEFYERKAWLDKDQKYFDLALNMIKQVESSTDSQAIYLATILKNKILTKKLDFETEDPLTTGQNFPLLINYRNIQTPVYLRIYRYKGLYKHLTQSMLIEKLLASPALKQYTVNLPEINDNFGHSSEFIVPGLDAGKYVLLLSKNKNFGTDKNILSYKTIQITNFAITEQEFFSQTYLWFFRRSDGKPFENLKVEITYKNYRNKSKVQTFTTDKQGKITIPVRQDWYYYTAKVQNGNDTFEKTFSAYGSRYIPPSNSEKLKIFTDRKIYRPGQTIYFKGLLYSGGAKKGIKPVSGETLTIKLYDANGKQVWEKDFQTNEYGTFAGEFIIPGTGLTGNWVLYSPQGSETIMVEEYKRPQFKVELNPVQGTIIPGDTVDITGKALNYNGLPVSGAQVHLVVNVEKLNFYWWYWRPNPEGSTIASFDGQTDGKGNFRIPVSTLPVSDPNDVYLYKITATVTDINGETHLAKTSFRVSKRSVFVSALTPEYLEKGKTASIQIFAKNIMGQNLDNLKIDYKIVKIKPYYSHPVIKRLWQDPDKPVYTEKQWNELLPFMAYKDSLADYDAWPEEKTVEQGTVIGNDTITFTPGQNGIYKIILSANDPAINKKISYNSTITVYSQNKEIPAPVPLYAIALNPTVKPGETAKFIVGSGWKDAKVLVQVTYNDNVVKEEIINLSASQKTRSFEVTEDMLGNVGVNILLVSHGRSFYKTLNFSVPYPPKKLDITTKRFTDKLSPGQQVEWSFVIKNPNGSKEPAEVLASMYDASLDAFAPNKWTFSLNRPQNVIKTFSTVEISHESFSSADYFDVNPDIRYKAFNYYGFNWYGVSLSFSPYGRMKPLMFMAAESAPQRNIKHQKLMKTSSVQEDSANPTANDGQIIIRTDFAETAFFYPQLMSDENGQVIIKFKVPESLTGWNFQIFASDKNLNYGLLHKKAITSKKLMLFPNEPRFVRQGDTLVFSSKISNTSQDTLDVKVTLEIRNARTGETLNIISPANAQNMSLTPGQSKTANWTLFIPQDLTDPVIYKIIAQTGSYSDGQQNIIPVLSNRILVTETQPLPVNGKQTKTFTINRLLEKPSQTAQPYKLTFEFNSNPVWYAITALPYMMEYPHECNEQLFARFYSNTLAAYIVNSDPAIKTVFELWKKQQSQALVSELEKKQELKQIVLDATPWLLAGKSETEQKQRLAILMDMNKMAYEQQKSLDKLLKNQNNDGGWPWFKGGHSDWFVTQYILTGFARLNDKNVWQTNGINAHLDKAVKFTDNQMHKYYNELKKYLSKQQMAQNHLTPYIVQYLYMRSFYQHIPVSSGKADTAFDYFYGQLKRYWTSLNLYSQAMAAIALDRWGDGKLAAEIIESIKQRSLTDDELGTYWANNKSGWFWYQAPVETQAMIIEAFDKLTHDTVLIENAKKWLLKQKQTTHWATTKATTEAIWALVFTGYNWLGEKQPVSIKLGNITLPEPGDKVEAGTGYIQKVWTAGQITPDMGKITITNPNNHPAWGAVYYQYFENIDKVQAWNTNLKIQRELYKEVTDNTGTKLQKITPQTPLYTGDVVVVRLVIQTDRAMDYVHIKDLRPSGFEPVEQISGYRWKGGLGYYQSIRDASANFFVSHLQKGTYVFEYRLFATIAGKLSGGLTTIQCMYAPEFSAHSRGQRINVNSSGH